jgi:undecaprenyl-phosphate 4-deoxy-4-formamido-L-arabinose transferase
VAHAARAVGDSKYSLWKLINLQFNLLTCMTTVPLRLLTYFGMLAGFSGFLLSLYIIIRRFCWADGDQWANGGVFTLFAVMFVFTGIHMVGIGVIGEYIGRLYTDVRARPRYFVEEIVGRKEQ